MEQKIIQREHSYIADDKTLCIYIADNETLLKEHSQRSGFPITKILEVHELLYFYDTLIALIWLQ
jgi:hypothetical protein